MGSYHWLWRYLRAYIPFLLAALLLVVLASMLNMVNPYLSGYLVDHVIVAGQFALLMRLVAIMVAATLAKSIVRYAFQMIFEHVSQDVIFSIRRDLYRRLHGLDFTFFDRTKTGDIMARMTGDMDAVRHFVAWVIYMVFENGAIFLFSVAILFTINAKLAAVLFALTPAVGWFAGRLAGAVKPTFHEIREQFSTTASNDGCPSRAQGCRTAGGTAAGLGEYSLLPGSGSHEVAVRSGQGGADDVAFLATDSG